MSSSVLICLFPESCDGFIGTVLLRVYLLLAVFKGIPALVSWEFVKQTFLNLMYTYSWSIVWWDRRQLPPNGDCASLFSLNFVYYRELQHHSHFTLNVCKQFLSSLEAFGICCFYLGFDCLPRLLHYCEHLMNLFNLKWFPCIWKISLNILVIFSFSSFLSLVFHTDRFWNALYCISNFPTFIFFYFIKLGIWLHILC